MFLWSIFIACSLHYNAKGLIFQPEPIPDLHTSNIYIGTSEGDVFRLRLGEDGLYFPKLLGCGAEVTGVRVGKQIWVDSWTVTDAGDGSAPFLGVLKEKYGRLMLHDINTDTEIELILTHIDTNVWDFVHQPLLVTGIVIGPHQVQVMSVKVLVDDSNP